MESRRSFMTGALKALAVAVPAVVAVLGKTSSAEAATTRTRPYAWRRRYRRRY